MDNFDKLEDLEEHQFTEEDVEYMRNIFENCGADDEIQTKSLGVAFAGVSLKTTAAEMEALIVKIEGLGYDTLTFSLFLKVLWHGVCQQLEERRKFLEEFKTFDTEGTGYITIEQIHEIIALYAPNCTNEERNYIISLFNIKDGKCNYIEFIENGIYKDVLSSSNTQ